MEKNFDKGQELYSHCGVLVKSVPESCEEYLQGSGSLSVVEYSNHKGCIEWKPTDVIVDSDTQDPEWAVVHTNGCRSRTTSGCSDVHNKGRHIQIPLSVVKSFQKDKKGRMLIVTCLSDKNYVFFFQNGNAFSFVSFLKGCNLVRIMKHKHKYIVAQRKDQELLQTSFTELKLYQDNTPNFWSLVHNFQTHPYETTLEAFSKLTDIMLYKPQENCVDENEDVSELLHQSLTLPTDEYELIGSTSYPLPPPPEIYRGEPVTLETWMAFMNQEGRIKDPQAFKLVIFRGGLSSGLRTEVWKFLLGYYPWDSTHQERRLLRKLKMEQYFCMKKQWNTLSEQQEQNFSKFRIRKNLIEKDVNRTDRTFDFYAGDENPNIVLLYDILMTYVMYNFDLGYVQGMNDLLSPILYLMNNEVDAFWCFVGFMNLVSGNFDMDQQGMKQQLSCLHLLLGIVAPDLISYLDKHESGNMFFCFRWLLVLYKREFSYIEIMRLWEILWTSLPCSNFHLLISVAILDQQKSIIMENQYGFTDILKHINELSQQLDLQEILKRAEGIYLQLMAASNLPEVVCNLIGRDPNTLTTREESSSESKKCVNSVTNLEASNSTSEDDLEEMIERGAMHSVW